MTTAYYFQARVSHQISKLERRVKQEIALNQEILQVIEEDKRRKKEEIEAANASADERQKNRNDINEGKVLPEKEEKDTKDNDKDAQASQEDLTRTSKISHNVPTHGKLLDGSPIIAVLVFSCNRVTVQRCIDQLIKHRPSIEQFPIIVSEDCQHRQTAEVIARYGDQIMHIQVYTIALMFFMIPDCEKLTESNSLQQPDQSDIEVPPKEKKFKGYFKIARHYGWALNHVFFQLGYDTVIIVEDDLDIAPDFFEYFLGTYPLLVSDNSLWCVSAWNDNGKAGLVDENAADILYRTDFFPGLGWMLTRQLWTELSPKWPKSYWDDWIRQPEQRRNRACIRPEISRTRTFGKAGVSNGMFYERHLKYIKLNTEHVYFTNMNLTYLSKDNYDMSFVNDVYQSTVVSFSELKNGKVVAPGAVRIPYYSRQAYKNTAKQFGLMDDFRSGVPRTGYRGVVTFFYKGRRVHLAPSPNWNGYDITWS
ncbi:Alpha-1,3-mannosyl-glycoprotein 2-beta-N-acetylglucosaminyltransferase [Dufourea novaeangliae]|uniref:Alpha-1,3-mannosyl-glycoprotein 2-beta-N-acetylglucosaminyltransferase n=1 Tax=Dufourea novaeangliae TaxID=178035 RepID=A0A154PIQ1_DUFNO|nr:Alpha-1,3-mannosyl-glycoprotein 2-beta-N-acetylglucosaminyltransferase [Dufourea novaeangliae]